MSVRTGIIDSGVSEELYAHVAVSRRFDGLQGTAPALSDHVGHGDSLARLILQSCPEADLLIAQVFHNQGRSPVSRIAEALDWLVAEGAQVINMSFGLAGSSAILQEACQRAKERGALLIASAPAIGGTVFPAALPECLAVTGDARCAADEIAWLGQTHADLGACPMLVPGQPEHGGGSSFACARVAGLVARIISRECIPSSRIPEYLRHVAHYMGAEVRRA
ncbi:MAG: S8 family serine peptidase [Pseudomonas sp.]